MNRREVLYSLNNVWVLQLLEKADFTQRGRGHAFVLAFKPDLLQGDMLSSCFVFCLVDNAICTLTDGLFNLLVPTRREKKRKKVTVRVPNGYPKLF